MRGSDQNASLYWLARMLEGGEDPLYVARRLVRFASEDIGEWRRVCGGCESWCICYSWTKNVMESCRVGRKGKTCHEPSGLFLHEHVL